MKQPEKEKSRRGRKVELTRELASKIAMLVQQFPDAGVQVTWENIVQQVHRRFGKKFHRNSLSKKSWDGVAIIADAYSDAKLVQSRALADSAPKYANNPRSRLRQVIADLQAENLALREQLSRVRAQQYDEIHALLDIRTPLHRVRPTSADTTSVVPLVSAKKLASKQAQDNHPPDE